MRFLSKAGGLVLFGLMAGSLFAQTDAAAVAETAVVADTSARRTAVARPAKSPTGAMLRSMALPGWGQWYNGKRLKSVLVAGGEVGLVVDAIVQNQLAAKAETIYDREYYRNNRSLAIWYLGALILYSMADAYVDAHLFDFDESTSLSLQTNTIQTPMTNRPALGLSLVMAW